MVTILFSLFALLGLVAMAAEENVMTLTEANFQSTISSNEYVLAEFYAPWCGHCKSLAPEYEAAATKLKENAATSKIILAKVDATTESKLAEEFGISGFPTLKWFVNGKPSEYTGGRTQDTIINWIKKKTGPAVSKITTTAELDKLKKDNEVVVVLVGETIAAEFEAAAKMLEVPFVLASGDELKSTGSGIVLFKQFDEKRAELSGTPASSEIVTFVESHSMPLIVPFSQKTAQKIFGGNVKQHFLLFLDKTKEEEKAQVLKTAQSVAEENRGKYLFVTVDKSDSRVVDFFGIKDYPNARIVQMGESGMKKYKLVDGATAITEKALKDTIAAHTAGTLAVDLKSEEAPATNDGDVKVIVGKTFDSIVKQPGKDVFVEFYAPWCGHCKQLAPKYEELGKWAKSKPNLIVAKMDASSNEVADLEISSFPTLKLFKADSDEVVDYTEDREVDAMIAFLEKHASSCAASEAA